MLQLGIVFALLSALAANLGFLYKHRGANEAPAVDVRHPIRTGLGLWKSRWFAAGMLVGAVGWVFHTAAIAIAPMSVVQVVLAGGIVLVAVLADRVFGISVGRRQWAGLVLTGVGLAMLVVAMPAADDAHSNFRVAALAAFEGVLLTFGVLLILGGQHERGAHLRGPLMGAAAGVLFGVCNVAVKATTGVVAAGGSVFTPWIFIAMCASVLAYYISARSLQEGGAVEVIAITATGANIVGILGGFVVFGDPLARDTLGLVVQSVAFVMIVLAAALLPAPRAASAPVPTPAHAS
ncbi:DMT family transporter [Patulibacter americanus]|uniref:DMT family transporter n=1 Tax=Patulibacter americanus TaxID=588672 RepID=UPI0003B3EDDE|nr:DMT family transporter [Patulibacter americanus]